MSLRLSRRRLLACAAAVLPVARLAAAPAAPDPIRGLDILAPAEWRQLAALVDCVWPHTDAMPSATEAGCLTFLSRRLAGQLPGYNPRRSAPAPDALLTAYYRRVIARVDELAQALRHQPFVALTDPDRRTVVARLAEGARADVGYNVVGLPTPATATDPQLFAMVRRHVLEGYFSDPRSGGNDHYRAWEAIGHVCHSNYPRAHTCDPARKQHR